MAAPDGDVITPMRRGYGGNGFLRAESNSPSAPSFAFSCSKATARSPAPTGTSASATSWYCPRTAYTDTRPCRMTRIPFSGEKRSVDTCRANMTPPIALFSSLSEKYR